MGRGSEVGKGGEERTGTSSTTYHTYDYGAEEAGYSEMV